MAGDALADAQGGGRRRAPAAVGAVVDDAREAGAAGQPPVESPTVFNETTCRIGISGLVGLAESGMTGNVRRLAGKIAGEAHADRFADRAAIQPEVKSALVESALEVCRVRNLGIGPEATLLACIAKIGFDHAALLRELKTLAQQIRATPTASPGAAT